MDIPREEMDFQMARKEEYSLGNLSAFIIASLVIVTFAVCLRLWARKMAKIQWRSDDCTLIVALVSTAIGSIQTCHQTL